MTLQPLPNAVVHRIDGDAPSGSGYLGGMDVGADGAFWFQDTGSVSALRLWIQGNQAPYFDWWWRDDGVVTNTEALATRIPIDASGAVVSANFTTPTLNGYVADVSPFRIRGTVMYDDGVSAEESGLAQARATLTEAIISAGVRVASPGGAFSTPCVRIHPAAPWLAPSALAAGRRTQRWEIWGVAGRVDANRNYTELETLVSTVTTALDGLPSWSGVNWDRPNPTDMGGTLYLAARGIIETITEV